MEVSKGKDGFISLVELKAAVGFEDDGDLDKVDGDVQRWHATKAYAFGRVGAKRAFIFT